MTTFYLVTNQGERKPFALIEANRGVVKWWTEEGWIDTPAFVPYVYGGEPGASPINTEDLEAWQDAIPKPSQGAVQLMRATPPAENQQTAQ